MRVFPYAAVLRIWIAGCAGRQRGTLGPLLSHGLVRVLSTPATLADTVRPLSVLVAAHINRDRLNEGQFDDHPLRFV